MPFRWLLVALVGAGLGLAACSSSGSSTAARSSTAASTAPAAVTTTTMVQREQVVPTRTRYLIDGWSVDLVCKGRGHIPVVFQAGASTGGVVWTAGGIIPALGPNVFTCVFDRPGVSYATLIPTAPATAVLTPRTIEKLLVETLRQAHVGPRVVLVGHSIGGMDAVEFGAAYPNLLAGAVLLDPSTPMFAALDGQAFVRFGIAPEWAAEMRAVTHWPSVPLVVLTQDLKKGVAMKAWTPALARVFSDWHRRYARLSSQGTEREVPGTVHDDFAIDGTAGKTTLAAIRQVDTRSPSF